MEFMSAEWSPLGDVFFRKLELYRMTWADHMNISECDVAAAINGGPIALLPQSRKDWNWISATKKAMHMVRTDAKQIVSIYNAAGNSLHQFRWQQEGHLLKLGWTCSEKLICVQDDGLVITYNLFGQVENTFDMGQEAKDLKISDCRIFQSYHDSGIIVMTTAYRFWIKSDVHKRSSPRKLADVPALGSPPSCWAAIGIDGTMCALVARDDRLYLIDQLGQCALQDVQISDPNVIAYTEIAVSMNNKYVALFTATGMLWIGSSDLQKCFCEYDTKRKSRPTQLAWCGTRSVLVYWEGEDLLMVGPDRDWISYPCDSSVFIVSETDGARVISNHVQELVQRVPEVTVQIFQIGSIQPGAYLFEAERKFKQQNKEANDYIDSISHQMALAVEQCIEAAGHEFEPSKQKDLLRAASFGKCFVNTTEPDEFYHMCQMIRVLNAVRDYNIGIPLTLKQLNFITLETLIDRLVYRRHYLLARKICQYLKLKDVEEKILAHWACYKVENSTDPDYKIASSIQEKLGDNSGVSYSDIASRAVDRGKKDLAIMLLDHETKAANQIPLLMKIEKYDTALRKAIDSGDSNLVYQVIFELNNTLRNVGDFLLEIRKSPPALTLLMKYYKVENPGLLEHLYDQEDGHVELAHCKIAASLDEQDPGSKKSHLVDALKRFKDAHDDWAAKMTDDEIRLIEKQQQLEGQGLSCMNRSLHETIHLLITCGHMKIAEQMRKEFALPEKRFWWLKVNALAECSNWPELEHFSKSKKSSPIGYRPFVEACAKWGNKTEAAKYLNKIAADEKVKCLISIGEMEHAAEVAFDRKNEDELNLVLQQCTMADRAVFDRIQRLKLQLRNV